jgi:hypothetical protein
MTPRTLASKIAKLPATCPITTSFERDLRKLRIWGTASVWYTTQKEHWLGWLKGYGGPGYYERKNWNRDAEFVYNHIVCPPMILWLGEASGISSGLVRKAKQASLHAKPNLSAQAAAIRKVIPWGQIEDALGNSNVQVSLTKQAKRGNLKSQLARAADATERHSLSACCVYAIVERKKLDQDFKRQVSCSYKEGKPWKTANSLLEKSRSNECSMPVLFGNADDCSQLSHWGLLTNVQVNDDDKISEYTVDRLRKIGGKRAPQDLVLRSSGKNIAPHYIKSYAICNTPAFLLESDSKQKAASLDKSDAKAAQSVIESIFQGISADAKESYLQFLATSIEGLAPEHSDRWGTTLFEWGIRLNVGWVECLVLHPDGLNILLCIESAPASVTLNGFHYRWAPGCDMTTVPLSELTKTLPLLRGSHDEAVSVAARRPTNPTIRKGHSEGVAKLLSKRLNHKKTTDEGPADAKQSRYIRPFQKWLREFTAAAAADNYAELLRPIEHLELKCSPKNAMAATIAMVNAIVAYCQLDGRDCETFVNRQQYGLNSDKRNKYCLIFDISGMTSKYFGRILTDINFTSIDLEDLFDHPWPMSNAAGFTEVYITRLDGKQIGTREIGKLYKVVASDMYYGHSEKELSVDVIPSDFNDTVVIYAVETDGEDLELG